MSLPSLADAPWLNAPELVAVLGTLGGGEGATRVVGGAVRDALMGLPVHDVDLATALTPDAVISAAEAAGLKVALTGVDHGTVTVIADGTPFEVTTLRTDVETFGRHATVAFTDNWEADAARRDFTMNALYCDGEGVVFDPVGGIDDIESRTVRFIGDADARITEDYLRILRFFRFFAFYGSGRPDSDGLRACVRGKAGLDQLSAERVWMELKRLLSAPDPGRSLLWMRTTDVLRCILPEMTGTDAIPGLIGLEEERALAPDPMLRLIALLPAKVETMDALAVRLRLSRKEHARLTAFSAASELDGSMGNPERSQILYRHGAQAVLDRLALALAGAMAEDNEKNVTAFGAHYSAAAAWTAPEFPVAAGDLMAIGHVPGPALGAALKSLENRWVESGFTLAKTALIAGAKPDQE